MSKTKPEVSKSNPYWIDKHRYYELKHFCLQYPLWRKAYLELDGLPTVSLHYSPNKRTNPTNDAMDECVEQRIFLAERLDLLKRVANNTDQSLAVHILLAVTEGVSYEQLRLQYNIPCCRQQYYHLYRRFFWLLSKERK